MKRLLLALTFVGSFIIAPAIELSAILAWIVGPAIAANPVINCGSTYYIPLKQIDSTGIVSGLPPGVVPVAQTGDATKITATVGAMPGAASLAVILKPLAAGTGVTVTVTAPTLSPGSAAFNAVVPPTPAAIMLDIANMQSTTP